MACIADAVAVSRRSTRSWGRWTGERRPRRAISTADALTRGPREHRAARAIPEPRSALIPLCHLAQEQDGWLTPEAMDDIGELVGVTPAEVLGTASFYDMLHTRAGRARTWWRCAPTSPAC